MNMLAESIFPNEASRDYFVEDLGGDLRIETNYDYIEINISAKPEHFLSVLETLSTAVSNPTLDKDVAAKVRTAVLAKVSSLEGDPAYAADRAVSQRLFGTFPYGRSSLGTTETLKKIDFPDLIDAKQRFLSADNATLAIIGNFDRTLALRAVKRYFGSWLKSDKKVPATFRQPDAPQAAVVTITSPVEGKTFIRSAIRGVSRNSKEMAASMVFAAIVQQRLKARLAAINATDIFVKNVPHALPGVITAGFTVAKPAPEGHDILGKALSDPISEAEFQGGKAAFRTEWSTKDPYSFWLDADTYKIQSAEADAGIGGTLTIAELNTYADAVRKQPVASVLIMPGPPPTN